MRFSKIKSVKILTNRTRNKMAQWIKALGFRSHDSQGGKEEPVSKVVL